MRGFHYNHGDRPLDGYTIQRGVGRGGFGEVYYALSDAGREVALKVIQGYEQIELRGVGHCMNLKSPHLVAIFDVRHNDDGKPFVIMEYVAGPSLRELLDESPGGLGTQKAAFFLREIAKGLTYLHERGVVHRDLKPGNIFYEDGYVKIGDYGLSKAMSASVHSGQTITVGTVHYMAPEIGQGRYDRSIDIYALGVLLYEMLTGAVPFFGSSHGEILMKHLMAEPDLSGVEEPFARVIRKAMAKEPADRYGSVQEMVEDVFGAAHIQESVSHFAPESLSMVAERVARRVAVGGGSSSGHVGGTPHDDPPPRPGGSDLRHHLGKTAEAARKEAARFGEQLGDRATRFGNRLETWFSKERGWPYGQADRGETDHADAGDRDVLSRGNRRWLAFIAAVVISTGTAAVVAAMYGGTTVPRPWGPPQSTTRLEAFELLAGFGFTSLMLIVGATIGIVLMRRRGRAWDRESWLIRGMAFGGTAIVCAGVLGGFPVMLIVYGVEFPETKMLGALAAIAAGLCILDWHGWVRPARRERVALAPALLSGLFGLVMAAIFGGATAFAAGVLAGIALCVQALAPFTGPERSTAKLPNGAVDHGTHQAHPPVERPPHSPARAERHPPAAAPVAAPPGADRRVHGGQRMLPMGVSDRRRLWALLLAFLMFVVPVGGLHRFYAGKIGTGILWLCTLGLVYIGQIVDIVMLVAGSFRDKHGRRILLWYDENLPAMASVTSAQGATYSPAGPLPHGRGSVEGRGAEGAHGLGSVERHESVEDRTPGGAKGATAAAHERRWPDVDVSKLDAAQLYLLLKHGAIPGQTLRPRYMTQRPLAFLAFLLLAWALLLGLAVAADMPGMITNGLFGSELHQQLMEVFNYPSWPALVQRVATGLCTSAIVLGGVLLVIARRRAGAAHVSRAALGAIGLFVAFKWLWAMDFDWFGFGQLWHTNQVGEALEHLVGRATERVAVVGAIILLAANIFLHWPENVSRRAENASHHPGDAAHEGGPQ